MAEDAGKRGMENAREQVHRVRSSLRPADMTDNRHEALNSLVTEPTSNMDVERRVSLLRRFAKWQAMGFQQKVIVSD